MTRAFRGDDLEGDERRTLAFDPVREGERYKLSKAVSLAIWRHVRRVSTNERGECDEWRASEHFCEFAGRLNARGGRLMPDVGRVTRVGVELLGDIPPLMRPRALEPPVPGRTTLVLEAARWQTPDAPAEAPIDTAASERRLPAEAPTEPPGRHGQPRPLDEAVSRRLGALFGFDFRTTRVVPESPTAVGSTKAVTKDGDVHFRAGAYQPDTPDGLRLLAHELTHVVQQRASGGRTGTRPQLEREADTVAGLVTRGHIATVAMRAPTSAAYAYDEAEAHDVAGTGRIGDPDAPELQEALRRRGGGAPLPDNLRRELEQRLSVDLASVRIHIDDTAEQATLALQARAFTVGDDIFFAAGAFAPETAAGMELLFHELTHVVQGREGRIRSTSNVELSRPNDALEREAEAIGRGAALPQGTSVPTSVPPSHAAVLHRTVEEAEALKSRYTSWGNLDEAALGRAVLRLATSGQLALADDVFTVLGSTDRDDVAYELMVAIGDPQLARLAEQASGRRFLDRLFDELTSGSVAAEEQQQADRILQANARQTISVGAFDRAVTSPGVKIFPFRLPGFTVFHDAPVEARRERGGVWCHSFVRVLGTDEFRAETRTLPTEYFLSGIVLPETDVIGVRLYDQGGIVHFTTPLFLIQLANATTQQILEKVLEAAGIGLTLGAGALAGLGIEATMTARVLLWADRATFVLGTLTSMLREHRSWIIATFGSGFMDAIDGVQSLCAIYGIARVALEAPRAIRGLRDGYRALRDLVRTRSSTFSSSERATVQAVSQSTDELLQQVDQIQGTRTTAPRDGAGSAVDQAAGRTGAPSRTPEAAPASEATSAQTHEAPTAQSPADALEQPPYLASKGGRVFPRSRGEALEALLREAEHHNVEIRFDEEAVAYLNWVARREGIPPDSVHAVTLGDLIFVRPEHAENVRILREEMIHVIQQRGAAAAGAIEHEIEARLMMIRYRSMWSITNDEVREMIREIRTMRRTGRY